jgi:hypothetical protein
MKLSTLATRSARHGGGRSASGDHHRGVAKDGKVVCFFQSTQKFKARYATVGFSDRANLDEGAMWSTAFALTELTAADEGRMAARVSREHPAAADKQSDAHKANEISRLVRVLREHFPAHDFQVLAANSRRPQLRR